MDPLFPPKHLFVWLTIVEAGDASMAGRSLSGSVRTKLHAITPSVMMEVLNDSILMMESIPSHLALGTNDPASALVIRSIVSLDLMCAFSQGFPILTDIWRDNEYRTLPITSEVINESVELFEFCQQVIELLKEKHGLTSELAKQALAQTKRADSPLTWLSESRKLEPAS